MKKKYKRPIMRKEEPLVNITFKTMT